jgi:ABC-type bacteriocin/lantibiotic exporter with double-glycine peptidase domain
MPAGSTLARHCRQSSPGACLPACARMVLAAMGDERTEEELATILGSYEFGTPASQVTRLAELGYQVQFGPSSLDELRVHLEHGRFPIVFVHAGLLPWADFAGFHALVLTEVSPTDVALLDPALDSGPTHLSKDGFLLAWEEFDRLAAVISR